ncbi:hypothetical protein HIM_12508 [Hirsutella minnesotensis 3608]|uniref:Uncharacterized protein n=1 Tax=Hirsutella minnesotensis 3608 TaxID=1043627 RepID=A0A0F7ZQM1_9HYPO|nr:hypothetical protein HIM_12508 [Hirsutella minnesotensis 3608]
MALIDYTKWDNIDTDSEPEPSAAKSPPSPVNASPPLDTSASQSDAGKVEAVIVRCEVEKRRFLGLLLQYPKIMQSFCSQWLLFQH